MKEHKAGCKIYMRCAVIHSHGICPGPYGVCDCGAEGLPISNIVIEQTPPKEKECCPTCLQPDGIFYRCVNSRCPCHTAPTHHTDTGSEWEAEFERRFANQYPTLEMFDFIRQTLAARGDAAASAGFKVGKVEGEIEGRQAALNDILSLITTSQK